MTGRKQGAVGDFSTEGASAEATNVHSVGNVYSCRVFARGSFLVTISTVRAAVQISDN